MNQQMKQAHYAPLPKPGTVQNEVNTAKEVTEYEGCANAVTSRKAETYNGIDNSINANKAGVADGGEKY